MKKEKLIIALSALFFACGSNAESPTVNRTTVVNKEVVSQSPVKAIVEEVVVEVISKPKEVVNITPGFAVAAQKETPVQVAETIIAIAEVEPVKVELLKLDHAVWNTLLKNNVSPLGKVNYKGMKAALPQIETYLNVLKENAPKNEWSQHEKLAYWINLYNASTVHLIATNYPTNSITEINGGKPWDQQFVRSGEQVYSLNQIENEIVRPRFKDPRIHAALNCAAISCPNLLNEAYTATKLNSQLNQQCKVWVNDASKNKLTAAKVQVSQIFDWYAADFKAGGGVVAFLNNYATTKVSPTASVSFSEYNWGLNE
jgi:hypothetical protein